MYHPQKAGKPAMTISTPALVVDLDTFDTNVAAMASLLRGTGKTVRPHVKTHRTPLLAKCQLGGPATGVTCATVGEAEVMVGAGITDVLVANEVVSLAKITRLANLGRDATVAVAADSIEPVDILAQEARRAGSTIDVLIDVDILLHRCGVTSLEDAVKLARTVTQSRSLRLRGLMGFEGRVRIGVEDRSTRIARAYAKLSEFHYALTHAGFPVSTVSAAGTSTLPEAIADTTITEIQAGVYALMEPELLSMGLPFRCAATIQGTVISRHADHVVVDAGRRVVGVEYGPPMPHEFSAERVTLSDEHATITMTDPPPLGSRVRLVPAQIRTTFNLHDQVWVSRDGRLTDVWPVAARGRSQ